MHSRVNGIASSAGPFVGANCSGSASAALWLCSQSSFLHNADTILDFRDGDVIDLSAIDAIFGDADGEFTFDGSAAFSGTAGELRAENTSGNDWIIEAHVNGDGVADLVICVTRTDTLPFMAANFVL